MTAAELAVLYLAWIVGGASPGPATLALASTGMSRGKQHACALAAGIVLGSATWGFLAAIGLGAVMFTNAWLAEGLRYLGAFYILWLAWKSLRSAMRSSGEFQAHSIAGSLQQTFFKGALLHLTNPKAIFSWGAVFAIAVPQDAGASGLAAIWFFLLSGSVVVFFGYALLFSTEAAMQRYGRLRRWFDGAFAFLFGGLGLALLTSRAA